MQSRSFFLIIFQWGKLDIDVASDIIKGVAKGCKICKCSLIGGETAEMPGLYSEGDYDLAGFVVGIAERDKIIDGSDIRVGNQLLVSPLQGCTVMDTPWLEKFV